MLLNVVDAAAAVDDAAAAALDDAMSSFARMDCSRRTFCDWYQIIATIG
jgi:hypothetical protein